MKGHQKPYKSRRERRGVGAIMGGVILIAILVTTVLLYYVTILDNDRRKASYEIQSAQINQDKSAEELIASREQELVPDPTDPTRFFIDTKIKNNGSLPLVVSYTVLYCADCTTPVDSQEKISITLNAQEPATQRLVGSVTENGRTYQVDFITERGNVVSAGECVVDLSAGICTNDATGGGDPDFIISAMPSSATIQPGDSAPFIISVTRLNGHSADIQLGASTPALGFGSSFSCNPVTVPDGGCPTSTLTVTTSPNTEPNTYTMIITGDDGSVTHTTAISITVLEDFSSEATAGIIQGTGSVQLDFNSFGAVYPTLQDRDGVSQKGWHVSASKVPGYPGFALKDDLQTILVERMRNFDPSGQNMVLGRSAALVSALGGTPGNNPTANHICTRSGDNAIAYNNNQVLPYTVPTVDPDEGMQTVYFCSNTQGGTTPWMPTSNYGFVNPIFMVLRSTFQNTDLDYGQTVPYQSFIRSPSFGTWHVCLLSSALGVNTANNCADPTSSQNGLPYKYRGAAGDTVYIHFNTVSLGGAGSSPYKVEWIYPDGTSRSLTYTEINSGGTLTNLRINVPSMMDDDITPITSGLYILKVSDSLISDQGPHTMFMTFQVT